VTKPFSPELKNEISLSENHTENNWFSCPVNATVHAESQFSRRWQSYDKIVCALTNAFRAFAFCLLGVDAGLKLQARCYFVSVMSDNLNILL